MTPKVQSTAILNPCTNVFTELKAWVGCWALGNQSRERRAESGEQKAKGREQ